jgi:uncharacterized membrane protein
MANFKSWVKNIAGILFSYFLQGLLLLAPVVLTIWSIFYLFNYIDTGINDLFEQMFKFKFPGLGVLAMFVLITVTGVIGSQVFAQPLLDLMDRVLERTPLVKDIYSSLRDFVSAFLSNKKKFTKPVLVEFMKGSGVYRMGFITQEDLSEIHIKDKVAVYIPHSYNFSGNMYIINKDQVQHLKGLKSGDAMKFIVSGGITDIDDDNPHDVNDPTKKA